MKKAYIVIILSLLCLFHYVQAQHIINGIVRDEKDKSILAANVFLISNVEQGVITDFNGKFSLEIPSNTISSIVVSCIGFQKKEISLEGIDYSSPLIVILQRQATNLDNITVKYTDPISEQFAVIKMDMLKDVYLNPISQGDPLKAITFLPSSTTTDESANVSLRGSSAGSSRVVFNGVPIINPVRATDLNNQGFFSLLNPEVIQKQNVYLSNPPLTFGNSSAGLVEVETKRNIDNNELQLSAGLVGAGLLLSQKIKKDKSFVQLYSNYQFSDAFVGIQEKHLPTIRSFRMNDAGLNFHTSIGKKTEFNSFNYFINESFEGKNIESYTYVGDVTTERKRFFSINNLSIYTKNGLWQINNGVSTDNNLSEYGNTFSDVNYNNIFTSVNYKWFILDNTDIQFGVTHDYHNHNFKDSIPTFYYARSPSSPNEYASSDILNNILEAYAYTLWNINDRWSFSSGMRSNIPTQNQKHYFSSQMSFKFKPHKRHILLLSGGKYFSYSVPNSLSKTYNLLQSYQVALDYSYQYKNTRVTSALYYKNETGDMSRDFSPIQKTNTFGIEFSLKHQFLKYFTFTLANSFIHQDILIYDKWYKGANHFNYLLKTSLQYSNPRIFTIALSYLSRPGHYFNNITRGKYNASIDFHEPIFDDELYSQQFNNYNSLSINFSKYIPLKKNAFVIYASVNNVLNMKNERSAQYNRDYTLRHFDYHQQRIVYFGMVWYLNY